MEENKAEVQENQDVLMDKYLEKKNRNKKITISFILAISLLLVAAVMFMALYRVSVRPPFLLEETPRSYDVKIGSNTVKTYGEGSEEYTQITNSFEQMFSMSFMQALFSGQTGNYDNNFTETYTTFRQSDIASYLNNNENYINVKFAQKLTVKNSKGEDFNSSRGNESLTFQEYYVGLNEENKFDTLVIVIPVYGNRTGTDAATTTTLAKLTLKANSSSLYKMLDELSK